MSGGKGMFSPLCWAQITQLCQITSVNITKEGPLHVPSFASPRRHAHLGHVTQIISRASHPSKHVKGSQPHKKNQVFDNQLCSQLCLRWLIVPVLVSCKNRCQTGQFVGFYLHELFSIQNFLWVIWWSFHINIENNAPSHTLNLCNLVLWLQKGKKKTGFPFKYLNMYILKHQNNY